MIKTAKSFRQKIMHCLALLLALSLLYGCGAVGGERAVSSSPPAQTAHSLSLTVAPLAVEIRVGDVEQFSATVSGSPPPPVGDGFLPRQRIKVRKSPAPLRPGPVQVGASNKQVIWSINGMQGGNTTVGTINASGLYSSPSVLPSPNAVDVTAASVAEPSISTTALITLYNPVPSVTSVTPSKISAGAFKLTLNGHNFVAGAQVWFGGGPLPTTFKSSTQLVATGVATQPGNAQVLVNNPQPGSASSVEALNVQVAAPQPVTAAPTALQTSWNPAVLGVSWASDFTTIAANQIDVKKDPRLKVKAAGDGVTDDTPAIRAAIQLASSSGGGMVYFPTGDYKIVTPSNSARANPLVVPSRVILRGVSATTSRLFVNNTYPASETDGTWTWGGISLQGSSLSGMTDLGVYAVTSSTSPCALLWNRGSKRVSKLFFNNLDVHLGNSRSFWFEGTVNLLVQHSRFDSTASHNTGNSSQYGPISIMGNSNVSFLNNMITYHFGRLHMSNNSNLLMQRNTLIRDAENKDMEDGTAVESGGVELSFGQNIQVLDNTIQTLNAPLGEAGDGEAILSQQSTIRNVLDSGSLTAITSTTLTDTNALWGPVTASRLAQYSEVVAILTGSAAGEWRTIRGVNTSTKTLTLSQPWDPVPEVGSLYSIFAWTLMNSTIQGNTLLDNPNGIVLYDGCYDCTVQNNKLINSRGIILRTADQLLNPSLYPESRRVHHVAIRNKILNNTVSNTSGVRPAYIALDTEAFAPNSYRGLGMIDIQIGGNIVNLYSINPIKNYLPGSTEITQEGFFPCFLFGPAPIKDPVARVFQNVTFWNNSQNVAATYAPNFLPLTTHACATPSAPQSTNKP
jgi:parallel beta-helix repeat protein